MAFHLLQRDRQGARSLAEALLAAVEQIGHCRECQTLTEGDLCSVCANPNRDGSQLCIVETPAEVFAIDQSTGFKGRFFVLNGRLSPLDGIGPDQIRIRELAERLEQGGVREVIVATNPSVQGESTALLIMRMLKEKGVEVTRIALGVPEGGDLRYTDKMTLVKAMEHRRGM